VSAGTNLSIKKAGVYKIPIKLINYAEDRFEGFFDLKIKNTTPGIELRK